MKNIFIVILISFTSSISYSQCVKGNCHRGHGTFKWENGSAYDGYWVDGKPHGFGDFMYENGDKYKGNFIAGKEAVLGNILGKMAIHMMDTGKKVLPMELANIVGLKNLLLTKECLKMVNWKV